MRVNPFLLFLLLSCFSFSVNAQTPSAGAGPSLPRSTLPVQPRINAKPPGLKKTVILEYHSWFENLSFSPADGSAKKNVETIYYGFAAVYDTTKYYPDWGWGANGGLGQGYAVATGESTAGQGPVYSQRRVSWTYLRLGGRVFRRLNGRMDLGLNMLATRSSISFPSVNGSVAVGPNPFFSLFLEMRWRISRKWELVQAIGNSTNNAGANMRIGFGNTF